MGACNEEAVKLIKVDDEVVNQIKKMLEKHLDIFREKDGVIKPPVIMLTFDPEGQIIVVTSKEEFNIRSPFLKVLEEEQMKITTNIPALISTGIGSGAAGVNIGGESLTDVWPW